MQVKVLVYLVGSTLVDELTQSCIPGEWTDLMGKVEPFLVATEQEVSTLHTLCLHCKSFVRRQKV